MEPLTTPPPVTDRSFSTGVLGRLTRAEREVAMLIFEGASNIDVGRALGISRHTVEAHMSHIFVKLGIGSRVKLAVMVAADPALLVATA